MNLSGGYEGEMDDVEGLSDTTIDRLLAGRAPAGEDTLGLSRFAKDLRAAFVAASATAVQERHLAAIADAAPLHNDQTQPSAPPAPRAGLARRLPTWRRSVVLSGLFGSVTAKVLAGTVVAAATTGGLAAANLLPPPVQEAISGVAGTVGIHLPPPGEAAGTPSAIDPEQKAARATEILDALVKQVNDDATQPHQVGLPIAQAAQACAAKVSTIARQLAGAAATAKDVKRAMALAEQATAIAQEAVGCALPKPAGTAWAAGAEEPEAEAAGSQASKGAADIVSVTSGADPIVSAVAGCLEGLKPAIMQLAQLATQTMDPSAALALASKAGSLADTARKCAGNVGTAAKTAFALPVPYSLPGIPKPPAKSGAKLPLPFVPAPQPEAAAPAENPAPAAGAGGTTTPVTPSWWNAVAFAGTTPGAGQTNPAAPWMGMTGSWGNRRWTPSGAFWNPFQPAPQDAPKH